MTQYAEVFRKEKIDGEVLADMDHEMMADLGISSKFHRMRLMKVGALGQRSPCASHCWPMELLVYQAKNYR